MSRRALGTISVIILSLAGNLLLDPTLCVLPPCLTQATAYKSIVVGSNSDEARRLLFRAGVTCAGEASFKCS
jgi:hypothetical protein